MPPWPTSSSTSYRPAIFSPTTPGTLPLRHAAHAPHPEAEPEAAAPDGVEQDDHAAQVPERHLARLPGRLGRERDEPAEREGSTDHDDDERPRKAEAAERERHKSCNGGDQESGHGRAIGV